MFRKGQIVRYFPNDDMKNVGFINGGTDDDELKGYHVELLSKTDNGWLGRFVEIGPTHRNWHFMESTLRKGNTMFITKDPKNKPKVF